MNRAFKFLKMIVIFSILFGAIFTAFSVFLAIFFKGNEAISSLSIESLSSSYIQNTIIMFFGLIIVNAFEQINTGMPSHTLGKRSLSLFSKVLIIFPGLPLFGLVFSTFFVRLIEIIGVPVKTGIIMAIFTISFWAYGVYKCKTVYFKNT